MSYLLVLWCEGFSFNCFVRTKAEATAKVGRPKTSSSPLSSSNFFAGRPKAALLFFWLFVYFGYGVPLFIVILIIPYIISYYLIEIGKNSC